MTETDQDSAEGTTESDEAIVDEAALESSEEIPASTDQDNAEGATESDEEMVDEAASENSEEVPPSYKELEFTTSDEEVEPKKRKLSLKRQKSNIQA